MWAEGPGDWALLSDRLSQEVFRDRPPQLPLTATVYPHILLKIRIQTKPHPSIYFGIYCVPQTTANTPFCALCPWRPCGPGSAGHGLGPQAPFTSRSDGNPHLVPEWAHLLKAADEEKLEVLLFIATGQDLRMCEQTADARQAAQTIPHLRSGAAVQGWSVSAAG